MCHTGGSALVSIADKLDNLLWQLARSTLVRGSVLLGPRIASVPATMATLSIVPALRWSMTEAGWCQHVSILYTWFFSASSMVGYSLMGINMWCKDPHTLCLLPQACLHALFQGKPVKRLNNHLDEVKEALSYHSGSENINKISIWAISQVCGILETLSFSIWLDGSEIHFNWGKFRKKLVCRWDRHILF